METFDNLVLSKILKFAYGPTYCVLEDCNLPNCHHCYPVINCNEHQECINQGQFIEYYEFMLESIIKTKSSLNNEKCKKIKN